eukprot:gene15813-biopygen4996
MLDHTSPLHVAIPSALSTPDAGARARRPRVARPRLLIGGGGRRLPRRRPRRRGGGGGRRGEVPLLLQRGDVRVPAGLPADPVLLRE